MENSTKIKVISNNTGRLGIHCPEYNFVRTWIGKGSVIPIEKDILENILYDPGVRYMFDTGMLYIEDMKVKQELGLEPEDAETPVNIVILNDEDMKKLWRDYSVVAFQDKIAALGYEQVMNLADYAIANRLVDIDKCRIIKERCGIDIIRAIQLNDDDKN